MSSDPLTPRTGYDSNESHSSPATSLSSSPPSKDMSNRSLHPVSEAMRVEEEEAQKASLAQETKDRARAQKEWKNADEDKVNGQFKKLYFLLDQSKIFASIMQKNMQAQELVSQKVDETEKKRIAKQEAQAERAAVESQRRTTRTAAAQLRDDDSSKASESPLSTKTAKIPTRGRPKGSTKGSITQYFSKRDLEARSGGKTVPQALEEAAAEHAAKPSGLGAQDLRSANQPRAVTGGVMRSYQLEGLNWLASLYENGLNGILADEMGLGKTIQTISFLAFLREKGTQGPFLIVAPLSTLSNWIDEFEKWTPSIPTVLYHGTPTQRADIRLERLKNEHDENFPIVCTSYEICMNDRKFLSHYNWKFIIIDEGHRLKNLNCRLIKELKQYRSANRLLITGTPLQNNLAELWSLLNFLLPEVFDTLDNFESFFDFSAVLQKDGHKQLLMEEKKNALVGSLHAILKPFLLRRVKTDVETDLPKKREYILYAPLTAPQKELYRQIKEGNVREYLEQQAVERIKERAADTPKSRSASLKRKAGSGINTPNKSAKSSKASTPARSFRSGRKEKKGQSYKELSDDEYFEQLGNSSVSESPGEESEEELERAKTIALAKKQIATKKLQNPIMQLRLACNSPHNFYWPWSDDQTPDNTLITSSGKMLLLSRLLPYLFAHNHKVLIFSQFKTTLDILEDWTTLIQNWPCCRIDGGVSQDDRRQQIRDFNTRKEVKLFLLSTRAGGQGINLVAADTVILFDSDWNPQQDLQAQDRAHRIGQTRPVVVYRLATKGTVEQTLLEKADGKRRLEKLVVRKGKFRSLVRNNNNNNMADGGDEGTSDDVDELAKILSQDDFERYEIAEAQNEGPEGAGTGISLGLGILSDEDLKILTDRSESAYARAEKGLDARERFRNVETKREGGGNGILGDVKAG